MNTGEDLTRWAARVALSLYVLSLVLRLSSIGRRNWLAAARLAWTGGFASYLVHVAFAFEFVHHWSHVAAYEHTAHQTAEVVGLNWGGGLYVNYIFALVWGADVFWWWRDPAGYQIRPRWIEWSVQGFLAFMAFNATVVFGHGPIRWAGAVTCLLLAGLIAYQTCLGRKPGGVQHP